MVSFIRLIVHINLSYVLILTIFNFPNRKSKSKFAPFPSKTSRVRPRTCQSGSGTTTRPVFPEPVYPEPVYQNPVYPNTAFRQSPNFFWPKTRNSKFWISMTFPARGMYCWIFWLFSSIRSSIETLSNLT